MAMEAADRCPMCLGRWDDAAYVMPCMHRFCSTCILRWAETKADCPLCRGRVTSVLHLVQWDDNFEERVIVPPPEQPVVAQPTQGAPGWPATNHRPAASQPSAVELVPSVPVGGLRPGIWAVLFRRYPALLQPLLPWLRRELRQIYQGNSGEAAAARRIILSWLCIFGPDEEALTQLLQVALGMDMGSFVRQMIDTILDWCRQEIQQQMGPRNTRATEELEDSPAAALSAADAQEGSSAPAAAPANGLDTSEAEELPSTSSAALQGCHSSPVSAPIPANGEQETPREEPEEAGEGPSAPRQSSQCSPERPPASTEEEGQQPCGHLPAPQEGSPPSETLSGCLRGGQTAHGPAVGTRTSPQEIPSL